jgi:hypothetical protein
MRKEYDFSKAERGKYYGRVRVVGPVKDRPPEDVAGKLRKSLENDLKKFGLLEKLDRSERAELRKLWIEKIDKALA